MKITFKKAIASLMAFTTLSTGAVGFNASATTVTNPYAMFDYNKSNTFANCTITNTTSTIRRGQVSMTVYTLDGTKFRSGYGDLGNWESAECRYNGSIITGVEFYGTLYFNTQPVGNPVAYWHVTL